MKTDINGIEIPSEDWLEGFCVATVVASKMIERKCYPTLLGEALLNLAEDIKAKWEAENGQTDWCIRSKN